MRGLAPYKLLYKSYRKGPIFLEESLRRNQYCLTVSGLLREEDHYFFVFKGCSVYIHYNEMIVVFIYGFLVHPVRKDTLPGDGYFKDSPNRFLKNK